MAVYGRDGSRGFSMRTVASEVGITATAIYRHYPDKAALAAALVERARVLLGEYLRDGARGSDSFERLASSGKSYVRFVMDHPQLYRLLFMDPLDDSLPNVHEMQTGEDAAPFLFAIELTRQAMDDGFLAQGDPGKVALTMWAHVHGLCTLALAGRIPIGELQEMTRASALQLYEGTKRRKG